MPDGDMTRSITTLGPRRPDGHFRLGDVIECGRLMDCRDAEDRQDDIPDWRDRQ